MGDASMTSSGCNCYTTGLVPKIIIDKDFIEIYLFHVYQVCLAFLYQRLISSVILSY